MKLRSRLFTTPRAAASSADNTVTSPVNATPSFSKLLPSDASIDSDISQDTSSSNSTSNSSLQSHVSLQTLPSLPSLQSLSHLDTRRLSLSPPIALPFLYPTTSLHFTSLALSGSLLYSASGHQITVHDSTTLTHLDTFNSDGESSGSVKSIVFSNGKIFTAQQDGKIRAWKLTASKRHKLIATLPSVTDRFRHLAWPKSYVQVRRHKKRLWIEHNDAVSGLEVNNGLIYSVSWDKTLKIWRVKDMKCLESITAHDDAINAVAVSRDGTVYTGSADRRIRVWAKPVGDAKHALIATLERHKSAVNALALNSDGSVLFSGACDRSILVWGREDSSSYMAVIGALRGHDKAILSLINVSEFLVSGSADRTVRIWRRENEGQFFCLAVLEGHLKPVKSLAATFGSPSDILSVFSGSLNGEIKAWRIRVSQEGDSSRTSHY
ncbi:hypothetical protein Nepgr_003379 [Nepenthes gracilis]|uniref:Uncharacterized protein n=1 Tax=Nepenthes gracilis TaxID=150966 RepID=A0AAD3RZG5_NEPGR|nr:hypothetical protein Nepgr_003379 [Nepenthes gracilis]